MKSLIPPGFPEPTCPDEWRVAADLWDDNGDEIKASQCRTLAGNKFAEHFARHVFDGEHIATKPGALPGGLVVQAVVKHDDFTHAPWEYSDGHGIVSDYRSIVSKQPGERILVCDPSGRTYARFYDWQASIAKAKKEGWDSPPFGQGTKGERAARAVQADFLAMKAWCEDEWFYGSVCLNVYDSDGNEVEEYAETLGMIEVNWPGDHDRDSTANAYLTEVANNLLDQLMKRIDDLIPEPEPDYILPAYWASALINGDTSGMENDEIAEMEDWLSANDNPHFVGCSDEQWFATHNDANTLGGDVLGYFVLERDDDNDDETEPSGASALSGGEAI